MNPSIDDLSLERDDCLRCAGRSLNRWGGRLGVVRCSFFTHFFFPSPLLPFSFVMQHISIRVSPQSLEIKILLCLGRCGRLSFGKHVRFAFTTIRSRGWLAALVSSRKWATCFDALNFEKRGMKFGSRCMSSKSQSSWQQLASTANSWWEFGDTRCMYCSMM